MKKNIFLVLIPLLAASAAAQAQSSVTLYGRINTTAEYQKLQGESSNTRLHSNSSYIGFSGVEDLGSGLSASFILEQVVDSTDGSARGFEREASVSLSGGFGTLKFGNYLSGAYVYTADYISLHNHDTGSSADALYAYAMPDNAKIGYFSPEFAGFTLELGVGFKDDHGGKSPYELGLGYAIGDLDLGLGLSRWDDAKTAAVRAIYNNGTFALGGYIHYDDNGFQASYADYLNVSLADVDLGDRFSARLVGAYYFGNSELHANVGWADSYDNLSNSDAWQYTLAYNYNLSARTKLYGFYTHIDNKANAFYGGTAPGQDFSSFAIGMRHLF